MQLQALLPFITYPDPNSDAVAAHAVKVAELIGADIHALAINADIPLISNALSRYLVNVPAMIREAETLSRKRGEHLLALVEKLASPAGVSVTRNALEVHPAFLGEAAAVHARYFDLVLTGLAAGNTTSRTTAEAIIFGSGRPVLLIPELAEIGSLDHVAVAWDGSRVASRAVGDARIFLDRAAHISVLTVLDEKKLKEKDAGERLVAALQKRGLRAVAVPVNTEDCTIAETLQRCAIEQGANLLVMGAYGHSRVRDFVLGGATEGILGDLQMPVLLSH